VKFFLVCRVVLVLLFLQESGTKDEIAMRLKSFLLIAAFVIVSLVRPLYAQSIPSEHTKALDDSEIIFPKPGSQQVLVFVIGFSKKGGDVCRDWGKHLSADYLQDSRVMYYQIPQLEGAPSFVRPMILRGMRKSLTPQEQSHFVPLYERQEEWKQAAHFSDPDDAYLIVADPEGHIVWQSHGNYSDSGYAELKKAVSDLLRKTSTAPSNSKPKTQ
jgi:hypothetical protein